MKRYTRHPVLLTSTNGRVSLPRAVSPSSFTALESRVMLSGAVIATVDNGNLKIQGDGSANMVTLDHSGLSAGQVRVTGTGGTSVNGQTTPLVIDGASRGLLFKMGSGSDQITVRDLTFHGDLSVRDTRGNNRVTISGVQIDGNLSVKNAHGTGTTTISDTKVLKGLKVASEVGGQNVDLRSVDVARDARILSGGKAPASVSVDTSHFRGNLEIRTGQSTDVVRIDTRGGTTAAATAVDGTGSVSLHGGHDVLQLGVDGQSIDRPTFAGSGRFDGGPGLDALRNYDAATYSDTERFSFTNFEGERRLTAETVAPTVVAIDPAASSTGVARNRKITATFSEPMDARTFGGASVSVKAGKRAVAGTLGYVGRTLTFTPATRLDARTTYTVTITTGAKDLAGNRLGSNFSWSFRTGTGSDNAAPTVTVTDPSDEATGVALNKKIAATFSEAMDPLTVTTANVTLKTGSSSVSGAVGYVGTTMTFTPTSMLAPNTTYTATITTGAKDAAGNRLANNYTWTFATGTSADVTAPTVVLVSPTAGKTNVALNQKVTGTFSESMDPLTLTNSYTLKGPGNANVAGTVSYNAVTKTATFSPLGNLAPNTTYSATISGGVNGSTDLAGNALASDEVWSFTTGTQIAQDMINLGRAGAFAIMATSAISGVGPNDITGDVGLSPGSSQGIPPSDITGDVHVNDQAILDAQSDLRAAYDDAISRSTTSASLPGNMGGLTFTPGLYTNSTSVLIMGAGPANNVTLDAQGDANAVFIFKMGSTLTTGPGAQVILTGGAKASNVFWQVGSSATLDTTTMFKGNILVAVTITVNSGSDVEGRLLAGSDTDGSVTVNASTVKVPTQ